MKKSLFCAHINDLLGGAFRETTNRIFYRQIERRLYIGALGVASEFVQTASDCEVKVNALSLNAGRSEAFWPSLLLTRSEAPIISTSG